MGKLSAFRAWLYSMLDVYVAAIERLPPLPRTAPISGCRVRPI
jgi:hypothetical protein